RAVRRAHHKWPLGSWFWLNDAGERLVISFGSDVLRQDARSNESPGRTHSNYHLGLQGGWPPDRYQRGAGTGVLDGSRCSFASPATRRVHSEAVHAGDSERL